MKDKAKYSINNLFNFNYIIDKASILFDHGFFHVFGSTTIIKIIAFVSSWIIVRIISKQEYGIYTYAYNIYSFIFLFNGLGLCSSALQICSENCSDENRYSVYKFATNWGLLINVLLAIIIIAISLLIELPIQGSNQLLLLMSFIPLVSIIPEMQSCYLRFRRLNKQYSYNNIASSFIILLFSVVLSLLFSTKGLVLSNYVSQIVIIGISYLIFKAPVKVGRVLLTKSEKKSVFSIALISMLNNGLSRLMYLLDVFIIGILISDSSIIASYKVATNIPTALQFIPSALIIYLYPYFAKHKGEGEWLRSKYIQMIIPFGIFNIIISLILLLFAKPIIILFFGHQYIESIYPFQILCVGYFFSATFRSIAGNLLVTQRKLTFNLLISLFSGIFNIVLNLILIKEFGTSGAAYATLITCFVSGIISTTYLLKVFNIMRGKSSEKKS